MLLVLKKLQNREDFFFIVFFVCFFILGTLIFKDYGLNWDDKFQRVNNGKVVYDFFFHGNEEAYRSSGERYHGPAIEFPLYALEQILHITDSQHIYFLRHFSVFLIFYLSSVAFYFLIRKVYSDWRIAIIGVQLYVLSPRIFADAFYNTKDLPFLSFFTLGMYTASRFYEKQDFKNIFLHALVCGFLIAIRITGVILPAITLFIYLIHLFVEERKIDVKRTLAITFKYLFLVYFFLVLFWPILWFNPIKYLGQAWREMSHFGWDGTLLFMDKVYNANHLPWNYIPIWILITVPIPVLTLFVAANLLFIVKLIQSISHTLNSGQKQVLLNIFAFLCYFLLPMFAVIYLKSVVYDGWRHLYFISAPLIALACYPVYFLFKFEWINKKIVFAILALSYFPVVAFMIKNHPYQNLYFNQLMFRNLGEARFKFEMDYWGLTFRNGLNYICESDPRDSIKIRMDNDAAELSVGILDKKFRDRIVVVYDLNEADYLIGNYRWRKSEYEDADKEVYSLIVDSGKVMGVFQLKTNAQLGKTP